VGESSLEDAAEKISLDMEAGDHLAAATAFTEVSGPFLSQGLGWELIRLSNNVTRKIDWSDDTLFEQLECHRFFRQTVELRMAMGLKSEAYALAEQYDRKVTSGTVNYIAWCMCRCRIEWLSGNLKQAIEWGARGRQLKQESDIDTQVDVDHGYHLALRDNGEYDLALEFFSHGLGWQECLAKDSPVAGSSSGLGNVGRCLQLKGMVSEALLFYTRSAAILAKASRSATDEENRGYAAMWIGQCLAELNRPDLAVLFLARCRDVWSRCMPVRLGEVLPLMDKLAPTVAVPEGSDRDATQEKCDSLVERWRRYSDPERLVSEEIE
jgi:tetratricopeptide (TPR) repeat protein